MVIVKYKVAVKTISQVATARKDTNRRMVAKVGSHPSVEKIAYHGGSIDAAVPLFEPAIYPKSIERKGVNRVKWLQWEQTLLLEQNLCRHRKTECSAFVRCFFARCW